MGNSFFNTNKAEQTALILLLLGIIALKSLCFDYWHLQHPRTQKRLALDSARYELQAYARQYLAEGHSTIRGSAKKHPDTAMKYSETYRKYAGTSMEYPKTSKSAKETDYKLPETALSLRDFDPNTADSLQLQALGLSSFVQSNILKYRARGGVFRQKSDFAKIYGLEQETYKILEPYIMLPDSVLANPKQKEISVAMKNSESPPVAKKNSLPESYSGICRINTADTADLIQYPGIGLYTAIRILDYRECLGGFYSPDQLDEISGIYPENLKVLNQCLQIDSSEICKLKLNYCSLEQLRAHPYLTFYQARAVVEFRQSRGKITCPEDLLFLEEFSDNDLNRLRCYLDCR
ncbi:MAG: helix-hairpin-helix domain-containing protein [Bacteroidales bacterium]|nr:helix-hairpin-helix domain-containing protein [Bacteroidales bacterium]MDD3431281.1 helix-hairpin-helix domain-containing protein [Bacteroidales bacterium]MDD4360857.1 helix-hairpin-helix domain-containing protein [Bacteroidales bacterium]MDD4430142.1 helix-hairpin-helix domain-containing protein [Bacteroidales bacterium]